MKLLAEFTLDEKGKPLSIADGNTEHFSISLKVTDTPAEVKRVKYILDPTYMEPERVVPARIPDFEEPITSFGDYEIEVEYEAGGKKQRLKRLLSEALEEAHSGAGAAEIRDAIQKVRRN